MDQEAVWKTLLKTLEPEAKKEKSDPAKIGEAMGHCEPADIALAFEELDPKAAQRFFALLEGERAAQVLSLLGADLAKPIAHSLSETKLHQLACLLPEREAAALLASVSKKTIQSLANDPAAPAVAVQDATQRAKYSEDSAGHAMTTEFVRLQPDMTVGEALETVRRTDPHADIPDDLCVLDVGEPNKLIGVLSIRDAVMAPSDRKVGDVMGKDIVCVQAETKIMDAARLLSKHKFMALPVVEKDGSLVGVLPADDLMMFALARMYQRYSKSVGTDAAAMERLSPVQAAQKRVPWLLGTMIIELGAALIVSHFNPILQKVILLASFMPVISAVSGNVGLQAAAITVRGLDVGPGSFRSGGAALLKEIVTTLCMAVVCGTVLGAIGGFWAKHLVFGLVVGSALTCSMVTAAFMGTLFPMLSKGLGFDPAATAGPFETAFQDVIGFGVFLGLATLFANRM